MHGVGASSGIGLGKIVLLHEGDLDYSGVQFSGSEQEKKRLLQAIEKFCEKTQAMADNMKERVGPKEAEILSGQIMMLNDPFMIGQMNDFIDGGQCAEAALDTVCTMYVDMFSGVEDEMMRQRATDVRDIRTRMLGILLGREAVDISAVPAGSVLVARDFTPSMTVGIQKGHVAALLAEVGGKTSHSAILARALEIPAVLGIPAVFTSLQDGDEVIVDGDEGLVLSHPDERTTAEYRRRQEQDMAQKTLLQAYYGKPTVSADGHTFALYANIGGVEDAKTAAASSAEGIGLFRTEFLFMDRSALPSEMEQLEAYAAVSEAMKGKEVIIRTLDVGGDKEISYLGMEKEENPFLGHRAIRYCLDRPDVFSVQLRALLRAGSVHKNIKIMLPLVTALEEVHAARDLLEKCKTELSQEGLAYDASIQMGVMIETPAAVWIADLLAKEADFFSIGTNDLTQYTMAVDRGNAKVERLYSSFNPAVLRSIRHVIDAAKAAHIPVGMCGESAADPCMIPLLMAFGLDEFSVSPASLLKARKTIASWTLYEAKRVTDEAMRLTGAAGIEGYLRSASK